MRKGSSRANANACVTVTGPALGTISTEPWSCGPQLAPDCSYGACRQPHKGAHAVSGAGGLCNVHSRDQVLVHKAHARAKPTQGHCSQCCSTSASRPCCSIRSCKTSPAEHVASSMSTQSTTTCQVSKWRARLQADSRQIYGKKRQGGRLRTAGPGLPGAGWCCAPPPVTQRGCPSGTCPAL